MNTLAVKKGWLSRLPGTLSGVRLWTLGALMALLLVWWRVSLWYEQRLIADRRSEMLAEVTVRGNALSSAVNRRLARLQGLHAFVLTEYDEPNLAGKFELFAAGLYEGSLGVRNLALAPGGTVQYVFPLEGNESVIGYTPAEDSRPELRADIRRAIATRQVTLSGPIDLVQGGQGLIARQAVFIDGEYWGLVNIVVDMPALLEEASLDGATGEDMYALRDSRGRVLLGSATLFDQNPVTSQLELPEGAWQLAAAPQNGWEAAVVDSLRVFQIEGLVIVALLTSLTYLLLNRQAYLSLVVKQRTQEISEINAALERDIVERKRVEAALREREEQYRSVFEATSDGLFINNLETGRLVDFNPTAHRMHGYTEEEFRQLQPEDFIHPDSHPLFGEYLDKIRADQQFKGQAVDIKKDGTLFHTEVLGTAFTYRGEPHTLAVAHTGVKSRKSMSHQTCSEWRAP
jgi:PAS domain S-box-containing protein